MPTSRSCIATHSTFCLSHALVQLSLDFRFVFIVIYHKESKTPSKEGKP